MAAKKTPPKSSSRSKSPSRTTTRPVKAASRSSAKATVSGPTRKGGASAIADAATAKVAGREAVAASIPYNAAKAGEFGKAALQPPQGQTVELLHPMVGGSTLTEVNASEKL